MLFFYFILVFIVFFSIFAVNLILMIMDENIIQSKLERLLPCYYEVQVWHREQLITIDIISKGSIYLNPEVMHFLKSLHIESMHFGYHNVSGDHHVAFKVLG